MNSNGPNFTVNIYIVGHRPAAEKEDFIPLQNNGNVKRNMMNVFCRVSNPATQCSQCSQYSECLLSRLNAYCTFETVPLCGAFFLSKVRNHREIRKRNEKNGDVFSPICGFPLSIKTINNFMSIVKNFRYQTYMIEGSFQNFSTFKSSKSTPPWNQQL